MHPINHSKDQCLTYSSPFPLINKLCCSVLSDSDNGTSHLESLSVWTPSTISFRRHDRPPFLGWKIRFKSTQLGPLTEFFSISEPGVWDFHFINLGRGDQKRDPVPKTMCLHFCVCESRGRIAELYRQECHETNICDSHTIWRGRHSNTAMWRKTDILCSYRTFQYINYCPVFMSFS